MHVFIFWVHGQSFGCPAMSLYPERRCCNELEVTLFSTIKEIKKL
jgi:hypothetical protein